MKKTIILGNGFDLDLGFPTSYKNFIESTSFASNLWSGMHLAYGIGPHPSNLFRYIQSKAAEDPRWTDIEKLLSEYSKKGEVSISTRRGSASAPNVSTQEIYGYYEQLKSSLRDYLRSIMFQEKANRSSLAYSFLSAISGYNGADLSVLSFNYTLPEKIFPELNLKGKIVNIHGNIESDIILGINDSRLYDSSYSYMVKTKDYVSQLSLVREKILEADELVIFGHSLGETDRDYFQNTLPFFHKRVIIISKNVFSKEEICNELKSINAYHVRDNAEWYLSEQSASVIIL